MQQSAASLTFLRWPPRLLKTWLNDCCLGSDVDWEKLTFVESFTEMKRSIVYLLLRLLESFSRLSLQTYDRARVLRRFRLSLLTLFFLHLALIFAQALVETWEKMWLSRVSDQKEGWFKLVWRSNMMCEMRSQAAKLSSSSLLLGRSTERGQDKMTYRLIDPNSKCWWKSGIEESLEWYKNQSCQIWASYEFEHSSCKRHCIWSCQHLQEI